MFGAILKATNSSFQKGMTFCGSIYVKKVTKLFAFILNSPRISTKTCQVCQLVLPLSLWLCLLHLVDVGGSSLGLAPPAYKTPLK